MTTRTISPRLIFIPLCLASLAIGCGGGRDSGRGGGSRPGDSGTSSTSSTADAGVNNNPGSDGGMTNSCSANPSGCAQFELVGPPPVCQCLNVCQTGYTWNSQTSMCDPVAGPVCGNNIVEAGEQCDDGNTTNGDGCSSTCQNEQQMGMVCQDACQRLLDCTEMECPGTVDLQACISNCEPDPVQFQADLIVTLTCAEINEALCPNTAGTNAGAACTTDADCQAGTLQPFCIQALDMNGMATGWEGGYCTALDCRSDADCGMNKLCLGFNDGQGGTIPACVQGCDPANNGAGVCRMGYQCPDLSMGQGIGACVPNCTSDQECGPNETCNVATGQCQ